MANQTIANGETGLSVRTKLNANFAELYAIDGHRYSEFIGDYDSPAEAIQAMIDDTSKNAVIIDHVGVLDIGETINIDRNDVYFLQYPGNTLRREAGALLLPPMISVNSCKHVTLELYGTINPNYIEAESGIEATGGHGLKIAGQKFNAIQSSVAWNETNRTLTKAGAFAGYRFKAGDKIHISAGTGVTEGTFEVASKDSDNQITLVSGTSFGGDASDFATRWVYNPPQYVKVFGNWEIVGGYQTNIQIGTEQFFASTESTDGVTDVDVSGFRVHSPASSVPLAAQINTGSIHSARRVRVHDFSCEGVSEILDLNNGNKEIEVDHFYCDYTAGSVADADRLGVDINSSYDVYIHDFVVNGGAPAYISVKSDTHSAFGHSQSDRIRIERGTCFISNSAQQLKISESTSFPIQVFIDDLTFIGATDATAINPILSDAHLRNSYISFRIISGLIATAGINMRNICENSTVKVVSDCAFNTNTGGAKPVIRCENPQGTVYLDVKAIRRGTSGRGQGYVIGTDAASAGQKVIISTEHLDATLNTTHTLDATINYAIINGVRTAVSDPQDATAGNRPPARQAGETCYYSGKLYVCTSASTPTWELVTSS